MGWSVEQAPPSSRNFEITEGAEATEKETREARSFWRAISFQLSAFGFAARKENSVELLARLQPVHPGPDLLRPGNR
jgi:hypothetical protein